MIISRLLDLSAHLGAGREAAALLRERGPLILAMTRRELKDRYAGQALGAAWAVLTPLLMMAVFLMAFGLIFKGRIGADDDGSGYTAYLLAGLVPWMALTEILSRSTTVITGQANLVKQIVFPSEVLPLRGALSALPTLIIGLVVVVPLALWSGRWSPLGLLVLLPLCLIFFVLLSAGLSLWLSALGVFLRDVKDLVAFLTGIGLFLHPILYPPGAAPAWLETAFLASPFSHMLWCFRDALTTAAPTPTWSWLIYSLVSVLVFTTGWRAFRMMKPTFGNVL